MALRLDGVCVATSVGFPLFCEYHGAAAKKATGDIRERCVGCLTCRTVNRDSWRGGFIHHRLFSVTIVTQDTTTDKRIVEVLTELRNLFATICRVKGDENEIRKGITKQAPWIDGLGMEPAPWILFGEGWNKVEVPTGVLDRIRHNQHWRDLVESESIVVDQGEGKGLDTEFDASYEVETTGFLAGMLKTGRAVLSQVFVVLRFMGITGSSVTLEKVNELGNSLLAHLVSRNVGSDAAHDIVRNSLAAAAFRFEVNQTSGSATEIVQNTATSAVETLLGGTCGANPDLISRILSAKQRGELFSICFLGTNGVGKSTTLAKIAFQLKRKNLTVLIIGCDTFRAGAIDQLKKHSERLSIDLFEEGYNRDAASVAKSGIEFARERNIDVALVDTAGRMQDHGPLMAELGKLIESVDFSSVMFVGESSVGNTGQDQVLKFSTCVRRYRKGRDIDNLIMTKMDQLERDVGGVVTLVHSSGIPVAFYGNGQSYPDLHPLDPKATAELLVGDFGS